MLRPQRILRPAVLTLSVALSGMGVGCAKLKSTKRDDNAMILGKVEETSPKSASHRSIGMASAPVTANAAPQVALDSELENPRTRPIEGTTIVANRTTAHPSSRVKLGTPVPIELPTVDIREPTPGSLVAVNEIVIGKPKELKVKPAVLSPESLVAAARQKVNSLVSYRVDMNRQERVYGSLQPAEDVTLSVRRQPKAVRLQWPSGPSKGREVIFASADGQMHIHTPGALISRLDLAPDNPLVARNSRHPITEAGIEPIVANLEASLAGPVEVRARYEGRETPEAIGRPCHKLTRIDSDGLRWLVYLDEQTKLPTLVQAESASGELLERYLFRNIEINPTELTLANAFDPDTRWGKSAGGLLSRVARGNGTANPATTATDTTR